MKKKISYISLFIITTIISIAAIQIVEECDSIVLKKELKRELRPDYKYDSSKTSRFIFSSKLQIKEIEVPLFMGEDYRFVFNIIRAPKNINIKIIHKKNQ